ncbi:hypothetical protein CHS0354_035217 [Potamilus streckersoni]|uniref:ABC transporter domain-containing protein n=1 Tax=Potamilus streckersoni TaxID=2493646 RepID=A0AAE0S2C8_9BIVA|nr:hypothetical protein CHS0354_035217 [Potamilus streckersoni]
MIKTVYLQAGCLYIGRVSSSEPSHTPYLFHKKHMTQETLKAVNIHKKYNQTEVLKGIDLTANKGDVISIIGSSGSGKSTFLRCMNLLEVPTEGNIYYKGEEIKFNNASYGRVPADKKQLMKIRAGFSMVFQQFNLWSHMTCLENVMEAPIQVLKLSKKQAEERALRYLQRVGLFERKDYYPAHLSGGQQQRVGIARALAMEPDALLFDEPTSALDPELVNEVLQVIRVLAQEGRTMLVVTHEMSFAREVSDKVMFLHVGKVEEEGPPKQVFENPSSERLAKFLSALKH